VCSEFSKAKVFKDTSTVHFEKDYTALSGHEFLYVNSVLQYFIDLDELFKIIKKTGAKHILIDDWFVGMFKTFYSLQNAYGYQIPCAFMNQQDAIERFRSIGYKLKFITPFYSPILGEFNEIPMQNFPDDLRIKFTKTAFFQCE
jgi:putative methyltransferase (TIGR04325 family)